MSSSGPMTGMNSGIRSIGLATHRPATTMAIFARRGTRVSLRSRRIVVTQSGMKEARSRRMPAGRVLARTRSTPHEASITAAATANQTSQSRIAVVPPQWSVYRSVDLVGVPVENGLAALESILGVLPLGYAEDVAGAKLSGPAAEPVQVVLLLVQLGHGQFVDAQFLGDFDVELVALGRELGPFGGAGGVELGDQGRAIGLVAGPAVEGEGLAAGAGDQFDDAAQAG